MIEKDSKEVPLRDVRGAVLSELIDYCYTSKVYVNQQNALECLMAAHRFGLMEAVMQCETFCLDRLSTENAFAFVAIADQYELLQLQAAARAFVCDEFLYMIDDSSLFDLTAVQLATWLRDDQIVVNAEKDIFNAVAKWIDVAPTERRVHYPMLMETLRMSAIDYMVRIS